MYLLADRKTFISVIIVMVFSIVVSLLLLGYLKYENTRRDRAQHASGRHSLDSSEPKLEEEDGESVVEKREGSPDQHML